MEPRTYPGNDAEAHELTQRMEALARFGGLVAHDLNNHLTAVLGYTAVLSAERDVSATNSDHLSHVKQAAERAATYTRSMMDMSRRQIALPRRLELNQLIADSLPTLQHVVATKRLMATYAPQPLPFLGDRAQIEHTLIALMTNALEAGATVITISTHLEPADNNQTEAQVAFHLTDNGRGIAAESLPHVYEPFYSSKEGKGHGSGLTTAYLIIQRLGGRLCLTSAPQQGTQVQVRFPRGSSDK